jgi:hypothetical protein
MEEWKKAQLAEAKCCTGCAIGDDKGQWCEGVCACETVIINDISIHGDDLDDYLNNKWNQLQQKNLSPTKINKVIQPTPLKLLQWKNVDDLVRQLAQWCIINKFVRLGDKFRDLTKDEIKYINKQSACFPEICAKTMRRSKCTIQGGYVFIDEPETCGGMICLYIKGCNPKWSFWMTDKGLAVDDA